MWEAFVSAMNDSTSNPNWLRWLVDQSNPDVMIYTW
jgi:hypothetical protein